jgi:hypothetical protein
MLSAKHTSFPHIRLLTALLVVDRGLRDKPQALSISTFVLFLPFRYVSLTARKMPARNPTGFDVGQFKAAASPSSVWAKRDPWARKYVKHTRDHANCINADLLQ